MREAPPSLVWFRRDLRLADNAALLAAAKAGPVVPVFVLDPETEALGAASKWRLGLSLADLAARLGARASGLVLRRGEAGAVLEGLARETGATAVHWSRLYAPDTVARDTAVKERLTAAGITAESHPGHLIHEPWSVETKAGGSFKVFTPFWNAVGPRTAPDPLDAPRRLAAPATWPKSEALEDWELAHGMNRGAAVVARHVRVGEEAALARLADFLDGPVMRYAQDREHPDADGSSGLSENLTWGEISPRTVWQGAARAREEGAPGAETFLKELIWREFAWHLMWHEPRIALRCWREEWGAFPFRPDNADAERWRRAITGEPIVDAAMREMYVTGRMHNRMRMVVASYLTKHLLTHWKVGADWFADCLVDWDPASNALGWQWAAGSGPDAAPYFRVFNPRTQAEKFDAKGSYRARFLASGDAPSASEEALSYFEAAPRSWGLSASDLYPAPLIDLQAGRERALEAYKTFTAARRA